MIQPSKNVVLAELITDSKSKTESGLFLTPGAIEESRAIVVETGPESDVIFTPGAQLLYRDYTGIEIELGDKVYVLVPVPEILGAITPDE